MTNPSGPRSNSVTNNVQNRIAEIENRVNRQNAPQVPNTGEFERRTVATHTPAVAPNQRRQTIDDGIVSEDSRSIGTKNVKKMEPPKAKKNQKRELPRDFDRLIFEHVKNEYNRNINARIFEFHKNRPTEIGYFAENVRNQYIKSIINDTLEKKYTKYPKRERTVKQYLDRLFSKSKSGELSTIDGIVKRAAKYIFKKGDFNKSLDKNDYLCLSNGLFRKGGYFDTQFVRTRDNKGKWREKFEEKILKDNNLKDKSIAFDYAKEKYFDELFTAFFESRFLPENDDNILKKARMYTILEKAKSNYNKSMVPRISDSKRADKERQKLESKMTDKERQKLESKRAEISITPHWEQFLDKHFNKDYFEKKYLSYKRREISWEPLGQHFKEKQTTSDWYMVIEMNKQLPEFRVGHLREMPHTKEQREAFERSIDAYIPEHLKKILKLKLEDENRIVLKDKLQKRAFEGEDWESEIADYFADLSKIQEHFDPGLFREIYKSKAAELKSDSKVYETRQ